MIECQGQSQSGGQNNSADFEQLHHMHSVRDDTQTSFHETTAPIAFPNGRALLVGQCDPEG
jgi:hypothetical protein